MNTSKVLHIQEYELPLIIQEEKMGGYTATSKIWSDCFAQGETIEEALNEITYVASSLIELYQEENLIIPLSILSIKNTVKKKFKDFILK